MARIRSVHPSLFTDEAWVSCSPLARILYIGLMCEADDQGLFEWKTLQIRMRVLAGDNADVSVLLAELTAVNLIKEIEGGGKKLGAIRYFRRFQRPKKPNAHFVLPPEWRTYVGLKADGSEIEEADERAVPHQFPTSPELRQQMEDGGGRMEEESVDADASLSPSGDGKLDDDGFEACWKAYPHVRGRSSKSKARTVWNRVSAARRALMLAAVVRYAKEGREPKEDCGAPAMDRWLREERYLDWLQATDIAVSGGAAWGGPADVLEVVERGFSDPSRAMAFLGSCTWDSDRQAIVSDNAFTIQTIKNAAGPRLAQRGWKLIVEKERAA